MALTATTLNGAVLEGARFVRLTSATGIAVKDIVQVNGERMEVADITLTPTIEVRRGINGTRALAHGTLAIVVYGPPADFVQLSNAPEIVNYGADGAITPPTKETLVVVTKATAAALTLEGPNASAIGFTVQILSATAAAHTVTYTAGFYGDTTSSDVATFAAKVGASMTISPEKGVWGVQALANVTIG
jgi:hypothetical protein